MVSQRVRVLITRPHAGLGGALPMLPSSRFEIYPCPTIAISSVPRDPQLDQILARIDEFDFIVFASEVAVFETFEYLRRIDVNPRQLFRLSLCAVSPVVSQQLNKFGLTTNVIPNKYTARALADLFPHMRTHSPKVLFPRGSRSPLILEKELTRKGYKVMSPVLYVNDPVSALDEVAKKLIDGKEVDCIAFTSASSVAGLRSLLGSENFARLLKGVTIAAIGPITAKACAEAGLHVNIQPGDYTLQTMARAIARFFGYSTTSGTGPTLVYKKGAGYECQY